MSKRKHHRDPPPPRPPLAQPAPPATSHSKGSAWPWLTVALSGTVGFLLGVASAFASNWVWEAYRRPQVTLEYALLYRERYMVDTMGTRIAYSVTRDLATDCVATRFTVENKGVTRLLDPPGQLFVKVFITNAGRAAATNLRIGMVLDPQLGGLTLYHSPQVTASFFTPPPEAHGLGQTILIDVMPPNTEAAVTLDRPDRLCVLCFTFVAKATSGPMDFAVIDGGRFSLSRLSTQGRWPGYSARKPAPFRHH